MHDVGTKRGRCVCLYASCVSAETQPGYSCYDPTKQEVLTWLSIKHQKVSSSSYYDPLETGGALLSPSLGLKISCSSCIRSRTLHEDCVDFISFPVSIAVRPGGFHWRRCGGTCSFPRSIATVRAQTQNGLSCRGTLIVTPCMHQTSGSLSLLVLKVQDL